MNSSLRIKCCTTQINPTTFAALPPDVISVQFPASSSPTLREKISSQFTIDSANTKPNQANKLDNAIILNQQRFKKIKNFSFCIQDDDRNIESVACVEALDRISGARFLFVSFYIPDTTSSLSKLREELSQKKLQQKVEPEKTLNNIEKDIVKIEESIIKLIQPGDDSCRIILNKLKSIASNHNVILLPNRSAFPEDLTDRRALFTGFVSAIAKDNLIFYKTHTATSTPSLKDRCLNALRDCFQPSLSLPQKVASLFRAFLLSTPVPQTMNVNTYHSDCDIVISQTHVIEPPMVLTFLKLMLSRFVAMIPFRKATI